MTPLEPSNRWKDWLGGTTELRSIRPGEKPMRVRRKSRKTIDMPCVVLCDAINQVKGLRTTSSCCGHGEDCLDVWFDADTIRALHPIANVVHRWAAHGWTLTAQYTDLTHRPVVFRLASGIKGVPAFEQAEAIATSIRQMLADEQYRVEYGV